MDGIKDPGPIKPRIDQATRQLQVQIAKLDTASSKLKMRDSSMFSRVVSALEKHDTAHASVYANELTELRRMGKMITQAKLALEQVVLRLGTITEMGDVAATLAPTVSVIRGVREGLGTVIPEATGEIGEISSLLSGILVDAGSVGGISLNFEIANEEAEKTLEEAAAVAEQRMKERFPEIPITIAPSRGVGEEEEEGSQETV
jgi:division protein CdvB (Snf7/Vps24/ESCRT-III family)